MSQSRLLSALEAVANVAAGFAVALIVQLGVFPRVGIAATLSQNAALAGIFTAVSLVRSYLLRRLFDRNGAAP
ncbi:hypothetical protein DRV85_08835 [Rhodosalinus halophilus]|uniref:Uncharacterized protein n=1 Tax=Rhodosalinus halophilus TaxID=2259333 RepID=A0A365U9Y1_9RHOB|nr:hypothetical protein [Rhodosalinus halophilus]RBI85815.1 hypothetical protein DRV85_08835 [Rhodosalinus halophilus]